MAEKKKITEMKTIDDFVDTLTSHGREAEAEKALAAWDEYDKDENKNHMFNKMVAPAVDEFYKKMVETLDKKFGNKDDARVHNKRKELQETINESIEAFFKKYMPSALEGLGDIKDVEERYETLTHLYDTLVLGLQPGERAPQGVQRLTGFAEAVAKGRKTTVGHLKRNFYNQKVSHTGAIMDNLDDKAAEHYTGHIESHKLATYLRPKIEETHDISNVGLLYRLPKQSLVDIHRRIKRGSLGQVAEQYGFEEKEETREREPAGAHH